MARVKGAVHAKKHHKAILEQAQGYYGSKSRTFRSANQQVMKSGQYAFRDRRAKKRDFRRLWIVRITAACSHCGIKYSQLIHGLNTQGIQLNRKMLSELAIADMSAFKAVVEAARKGL